MSNPNFSALAPRIEAHKAVTALCRVAFAKATIPVLAGVLIDVTGDSVTLSACDCDASLSIGLSAECDGAGQMVVDAVELRGALKDATGANVMLSVSDEGHLVIECEKASRVVRSTGKPHDFATIAWNDDGAAQPLEFVARALADDLARIRPCVSTESTRYYLNGIFFHRTHAGELAMAATDGHRLARIVRPAAIDEAWPDEILHRSHVDAFRRLIPAAQKAGAVTMATAGRRFRLTYDGIGTGAVFICKAIDGTFPDYQRVIPTAESYVSATVDGGDIVQTFPAAFNKKQTTGIVQFDGTGQAHASRWLGDGKGTARSSHIAAPLETSDGTAKACTFGVNLAYMVELAKAWAPAGALTIRFEDKGHEDLAAPMLITSSECPELTGVLMPCRAAAEPRRDVLGGRYAAALAAKDGETIRELVAEAHGVFQFAGGREAVRTWAALWGTPATGLRARAKAARRALASSRLRKPSGSFADLPRSAIDPLYIPAVPAETEAQPVEAVAVATPKISPVEADAQPVAVETLPESALDVLTARFDGLAAIVERMANGIGADAERVAELEAQRDAALAMAERERAARLRTRARAISQRRQLGAVRLSSTAVALNYMVTREELARAEKTMADMRGAAAGANALADTNARLQARIDQLEAYNARRDDDPLHFARTGAGAR